MKAILAMLLCALGIAAEVSVAEVWSRATIPGQEAGAIFARITGGDADDRLLGAASEAAATVELHEHAMGQDGVGQMREIAGGLAIPAGSRVELKPRSYHIMLIGLRAPLAKGATVPVTLRFEHAGALRIEATILDPWAMAFDDR